MNRGTVIAILLSLAAVSGGFMLYQSSRTEPNSALPVNIKPGAELIGKQRPDFRLPDMEGQSRNIGEWDGKVVLLNFWATWCPPCRREIPTFIELQEKYAARGFRIIGVAIDNKDNVQDYMDTMGVNYPVLIGELDPIEISKRYGNRFGALPYSVLVDRKGIIRFIQRGELLHEVAETQIKQLL